MKKSIIAVLFASLGLVSFVSAANVAYNGTALTNLQGTTAATDLPAGRLGLIILDTTGDGILGSTDLSITPVTAGLDVGSFFGGDLVVARVTTASSFGNSSIGGNWTWNLTTYPGSDSKRWAIVWFDTLTAANTGTAAGGTKYGIASATSWITPAVEPGAGTTLTYATSPAGSAPHQLALNDAGSVAGLPNNATFATNGTTFTVVPEPSTAVLGLLAGLGVMMRRRRV